MRLPWRARLVIGAAIGGGAATLAWAVFNLVTHSLPTAQQFTLVTVFLILVIISWLRPLIVYVGDQSQAIHLDEGFFVVLTLLVRPSVTVITFALASVIAQTIKRRPLVKSAFNAGQLLVSVGAALAAFTVLHHPGSPITYPGVGAALVGAVVFFVVNSGSIAAVLASTGAHWREALLDGLDVRLLLDGGGAVVAVATALVLEADPWALPFAVLPLIIFREVLAGHFDARHDRARVHGLFEATLEAHRSMGKQDVTAAILSSARVLLRCSDAELADRQGGDGTLSAPLPLPDQNLWLTVSGRSRTEPFERGDRALLEALAAVGAGALSNASLYQEGRHQKERLSAITSSLGEGVCAVSRSGQITFINPAAATMLGWDVVDELDGLELLPDLDVGPSAPPFVLAPAMRAIATRDTITSYDTRFQRKDGNFFDVAFTVSPIIEAEGPTGAVLVFRDITERKELEEQLARHAFHDVLTGLPNRRLFLDHLDHALRRSERSNERHAVLFADVDRFKVINDSLGHHAGDSLLIAISERIQSVLRPGDMLARFGGDEFTVLLEAVSAAEDAIVVAQRVLDKLREPISLPDGYEVVATVSIGIALTSQDKNRDDVLHDADVAMYQAKASGRSGHYEVFDVEAMGVRSAERIELEGGLRWAIERDELEVYYQPLFSISDRKVVGVEALVRWNHPQRGLLVPGQFIGLAEDTGLILPLGRLVLEQACRKAKQWREEFGAHLSIGVNLSARQFQHAGLVEDIEDVLQATGVDPTQLCLEITESLAMDKVEWTSEVLTRLKALGVRVAIDDFGTGYSSLGYLASFPIDVVKIDQSFVEGVDVDPVKSAIVSAVITLSQAVGSTTVVEGVETAKQEEHLKSLGCLVAQGYHLARPMDAGSFEALLRSVQCVAPREDAEPSTWLSRRSELLPSG